jgi:uncharacterized protein YjbI with pentapeptide repeats
MSNPTTQEHQLVRFEEVTPTNTIVAFFDGRLASLVAHIGLPLYDGYDDLDEIQFAFLTLPSGQTVTLGQYAHSPQIGVDLYVNPKLQDIPAVTFETCKYLAIPRREVIWFHPDWQEEIEGLYAEHGAIEKQPELLQVEGPQSIQYEPIDCFNHALRIYTREDFPTYWAMLQHNLGLAYQNRSQGSRKDNLERSIECFYKSLEIYKQDKFPEKWKINQADLKESYRDLKLLLEVIQKSNNQLSAEHIIHTAQSTASRIRANLIRANLMIFSAQSDLALVLINLFLVNQSSIWPHPKSADLRGANLRDVILIGIDLINADLSNADLRDADLTGANLRSVKLRNADLSGANLRSANLVRADFSNTKVNSTQFAYSTGISASLKRDLINRGAIFDNIRSDESEDRNLVLY